MIAAMACSVGVEDVESVNGNEGMLSSCLSVIPLSFFACEWFVVSI